MLQIVQCSPLLRYHLKSFFEKVNDNPFFHPHPFTYREAVSRCEYIGDDIYTVLKDGNILAYGFVRGIGEWDTPCLGVCVLEECRGEGLGELLVRYLHAAAKLKGIERLRLHVSPENIDALLLYGKLGYRFNGEKHNGELIGYKDL